MTAQQSRGLASADRPTRGPGEPVTWPVRSGVMPPLAAGFIMRQETAPDLGRALIPGSVAALVPAGEPQGWPGVGGKTQLAVQLAESLWRSREVELLAWVTATSRAAVLAGYADAAAAVTGAGPAADGEAAAARLLTWLSGTGRPWLVVLDDLASPADLDGLWPTGRSGRVLITTRGRAGLPAEAAVLPVGDLSLREGTSYLMGRLAADQGQRLGALDLVKDLGCEPLALAQASAVIVESALSCQDYREFFARRREQMAEDHAGPTAAASVTWTFSFEHAGRLSPDGAAQLLLALAALLDGRGIPGVVFTAAAAREYLRAGTGRDAISPEQVRDALLLLARQGLLDIDAAAGRPTIWMSPEVQAAVRAHMPADMLSRASLAAAGALLESWPEDDEGGSIAERLRSSADSLWRASGDLLWAGRCHPLLLRAGRSLDGAGLTGPAFAYWRELVVASDRVLGPGHRDTLSVGDHLARACLSAGRPADAVPWFQWVLTRQVRALGPEHPGTTQTRGSLGRALLLAGEADAAVTMLTGAVSDYERVHGPDHLETLRASSELADAHAAAGQFEPAIQLLELTLQRLERQQGARHPDTMAARQKLAEAYQAAGRVKDAQSQYKRALADREHVLGPDDPDTIATLISLGSAHQSAGRITSALQVYEQASARYERALGAEHRTTLAHAVNLADTYYAAGRLMDATTLLRETLTRCERVLPAGDPLTQSVHEALTDLLG
jgi:tetratricopeptide (TPR) repeat protein